MPHIFYAQFRSSIIQGEVKPGFYPGVLIIESGPAKGHYAVREGNQVVEYEHASVEAQNGQRYQVTINTNALDDVVRCGNEAGPAGVKCKLDHNNSVTSIVGKYTNFRRDGEQVRADLTLLESSPQRKLAEELIKEMSNSIGNSIDFNYVYDIDGSSAVARCRRLNSVDIVDRPATTNSLFNEQPDNYMPLTTDDLKQIGELFKGEFSEIKTQISSLSDRQKKLAKRFEEGEGDDGDGDGDGDEKKDKKKDKEKDNDDDSKMESMIQRAVMASHKALFPKAPKVNLASEDQSGGSQQQDLSPFEKAVAAQMSTGGCSRGIAIVRVSKDKPALYNQYVREQQGVKENRMTA